MRLVRQIEFCKASGRQQRRSAGWLACAGKELAGMAGEAGKCHCLVRRRWWSGKASKASNEAEAISWLAGMILKGVC